MNIRLLRFSEVQAKVGLSRTTLWRLEREHQFPKRKRIGKNSVGWLESEVDEWISSRVPGLK
jgi:prophage regulatory protein